MQHFKNYIQLPKMDGKQVSSIKNVIIRVQHWQLFKLTEIENLVDLLKLTGLGMVLNMMKKHFYSQLTWGRNILSKVRKSMQFIAVNIPSPHLDILTIFALKIPGSKGKHMQIPLALMIFQNMKMANQFSTME